jgi:acetyltransferase-like isoleucine patch superfamily enzyme
MITVLARHTAKRWVNALRLARLEARFPGVRISPHAVISGADRYVVQLARGVSVGAFSVIIMEADPANRIPAPALSIGENSYIGELNNLRISAPTVIGKNCLISQGCSIITANHNHAQGSAINAQGWDDRKFGVTIGDDVWLGAHSCILPGVNIGGGAVIGAGSVVTRDVAPGAIVAGVPARPIATRQAAA